MSAIEMKPIDSDAIKSAGHDGSSLHLAWKSGTTSIHRGVTEAMFKDFLRAPSKGAFFHAHVRKQYPGVAK